MTKKYDAMAFFDLDGTLLDEKSRVSQENAIAMTSLIHNNVLPVIATGRTNLEIGHIMREANITSAITMNGQYVEVEGDAVYGATFSHDVCQEMLTLARSLGHELGFYNHKMIRVTDHTPIVKKCYDFIHSDMPKIDEKAYEKEPIHMLLVLGEDQDEAYHKTFPDLTFYRNGPFSIDTVTKGGSKGKGILELKKALGLDDVPTYCFGDGLNDISMFEVCDHGIAMGNSRKELLDYATYFTKSNNDGGIVHGLKHFGLI